VLTNDVRTSTIVTDLVHYTVYMLHFCDIDNAIIYNT